MRHPVREQLRNLRRRYGHLGSVGSRRLRRDRHEQLFEDLFELDRVGGEVAEGLLHLLLGGARHGPALPRPDLVGQPVVERLEPLVRVSDSLRVHRLKVSLSPGVRQVELHRVVGQPVDLGLAQAVSEARHGPVALGDAPVDREVRLFADQLRMREIEVGIEVDAPRVALAVGAMAAGAVLGVELGGRPISRLLAAADRREHREREGGSEAERPSQGFSPAGACVSWRSMRRYS